MTSSRPPSGTYPSVRPVASSPGPQPGQVSSPCLHRPLAKCHADSLRSPVAASTAVPASLASRALRSAIDRLGCSVADAARWCGVERRTVQRWLSGDAPVNHECVMRSRRLWPVFLEELTALTLGERRTG